MHQACIKGLLLKGSGRTVLWVLPSKTTLSILYTQFSVLTFGVGKEKRKLLYKETPLTQMKC